jgi:hypothetical protein
MLSEGDVIAAVCRELRLRGYEITQQLSTSQKGYDIVAVKRAGHVSTIYVEAKGETSSRSGSGRYGKAFDASQVRDHVGAALYKACVALGEYPAARAAVALPDTPRHRSSEAAIHLSLIALGVGLMWVRPDRTVVADAPWEL